MTRKEAMQTIGGRVHWDNMPASIDAGTTILERIGAQGLATITYCLTPEIDYYYKKERFQLIESVKKLKRF